MMKLLVLLLPLAWLSPAAADPAKPAARFAIAVTTRGFEPGEIQVPAHQPIALVFTRKTDQTCAKAIVIAVGDGKQIQVDLPLDKPVEVPVTFPKAGKLGYACSMGMIKGVVVVQ